MKKKLVIERAKWARGWNVMTALLLPNGTMCCLGFYAKQHCGLSDEQIRNRPNFFRKGVANLADFLPAEERWLTEYGLPDQSDVQQLINTNDMFDLDEPTREQRIKEIFARRGVEVEFV